MSQANAFPDAPFGPVPEGDAPIGALVREPLGATIRRVAVPAVVANLLMTAFHNIDTLFIGRFLGADALAATTSAVFWIWLVLSIGEMVSIGVDAIAARRHGERRPTEAARVVGEGLLFAVLLGVGVAMLTPFVLDTLFAAMHVGGNVASIGASYLGTYLVGMPFVFGFFAVDAAFRASGDTRTPLYILAATTALALALDPVLILGLGIVTPLGAQGAALATLVPRGLACLVGVAVLSRRRMILLDQFSWRTLRALGRRAVAIARVGAPAATTGVAFSAIYVVLTRTTTQFGTPALAALGLGFRVESIVYVVAVGVGVAVAAIVGQSIGANDYLRAKRAAWGGVGVVTVLGIVMAAATLIFSREFAAVFSTDEAVIAEAARYLRIAAFSQLFLGAEIVLESAMGGAGYTLVPMLVSISVTASRVPLAVWSASRWGTSGIWWTLALTAAMRGVVMAVLWRQDRWRNVRV